MMNTPVLTALQQKQTLTGKKKTKKTTIKNVLASPYSNYWPLINLEEATSLNEVLNKHLLKVKQTKINVPWNELKKIPRENRKAFRLKYCKDRDGEEISCKSSIVFGVNETSKLLESDTASSVLISGDVNPQLMVKHVVDQAVIKNVPVLIVPNLKYILKEKAGIASLTVGFEASCLDSSYSVIDQTIRDIYSNYPVPSNHMHSHRRKSMTDMDDTQVCPTDNPMDYKEDSEDEIEPPRNLYLYRKAKSQRVFVPQLSQPRAAGNSAIKMEVDQSGFLKFDSVSSANVKQEVPAKKVKISYKSLIVKRVTNDVDREKKKIERLKRKR